MLLLMLLLLLPSMAQSFPSTQLLLASTQKHSLADHIYTFLTGVHASLHHRTRCNTLVDCLSLE